LTARPAKERSSGSFATGDHSGRSSTPLVSYRFYEGDHEKPPEECAMAKRIKKSERLPEDRPAALGELIHAQVRVAIETAVHEELSIALGAGRYERHDARRGYRNGVKPRTLTGPTGPLALTLPRATLGAPGREWRSTIVPRYQRRMREVNEAVIATYLAGGGTSGESAARCTRCSRPRPSPRARSPGSSPR
jgi:hypothetical protein